MTKGDRLTVRIPEDLKEKAREKGKREDVTLSQVVRRALREWVGKNPPKSNEA